MYKGQRLSYQPGKYFLERWFAIKEKDCILFGYIKIFYENGLT